MQDLQDLVVRKNRALLATIALTFLLLLVSAALVFIVARAGAQADRMVTHTLDVKQELDKLLAMLTGAEAGQRGYLVTSEPDFLGPYEEARTQIDHEIETMRTLLSDNTEQLARLNELAPILHARLETIEGTLALTAQGRRAEAVELLKTRGRGLMAEVRRRIEEMDAAENTLLIRRRAAQAERREQFVDAVTAMLVLCGIFALFAIMSVRRYLDAVETNRTQLARLNAELESRVAERTAELNRSADVAMRERARAEALLTDVNHRVGNNLALVSSFLTMQQRMVRNPDAARALMAARARVQAIASAHRKLRLGSDFATVKADEVLNAVIDDISAGLSTVDQIRINRQVEPLEIHARDAVSLGVLTSELVMNAVKHAFSPGEPGEVSVTLASAAGSVPVLEVSDDGVGFDEKQIPDDGLGERIIDMVARQFGGQPERSPREPDSRRPGTRVRIPLANLKLMPPP
jgi:two-component sensor histidine kinase/CHASE3 domain sensor protein